MIKFDVPCKRSAVSEHTSQPSAHVPASKALAKFAKVYPHRVGVYVSSLAVPDPPQYQLAQCASDHMACGVDTFDLVTCAQKYCMAAVCAHLDQMLHACCACMDLYSCCMGTLLRKCYVWHIAAARFRRLHF